MNFYLTQFILAGRNRNSEGLVDILIIVFFVVIWVIRNIFMAQKEQTQQKKKPLTHKPSSKHSLNKDRIEKFLENILKSKQTATGQKHQQGIQHKSHTISTVPKPVTSNQYTNNAKRQRSPKFVNKRSSFARSQRPEMQQMQELPIIDPNLQELPEFTDKTVNNLEKTHLTKQINSTPSNYLSEMLFDRTNPDELKKAILYSEILGKPLSIRDISD